MLQLEQLHQGQNTGLEPKKERSLPRWLLFSVIVLFVLGICFRFYNLDRKVYWLDEARTSLRMSGYTQTELVEHLFTGEVIEAADLQTYQRPGAKTWGDTLQALKGNAEHTPLYFLMARLWSEVWGYSVANVRGLSVWLSFLVFPCLFWFCRELFTSATVGWVAIAFVAITPLHVLYAQEARPYSLWTVEILLSSAALLWARRCQTRWSWGVYGGSLILGLYTQLLFGEIIIAHGIYMAIAEGFLEKRQINSTLRSYFGMTLVSLLSLTPWLLVFFGNLEQVHEATATLNLPYQFSTLVNEWVLNFSRGMVDRELGFLNTVGLILFGFLPLYYLYRKTPKVTWLLIIALVAVSFLVLALPDIFLGGQRSLRIRYLIPAFLGIQIALAYLFVSQIQLGGWHKRVTQLVFAALVTGGIMACAVSSQAQVWWNKSLPRSAYYPPVAAIINQAPQPLVMSDDDPASLLAISYWLRPDISLQLSDQAKLKVAEEFQPIYVLNPSHRLLKRLQRKYQLTARYEDRTMSQVAVRLWELKRRN